VISVMAWKCVYSALLSLPLSSTAVVGRFIWFL